MICGVWNLRGNTLPKGLVELESLFDRNDGVRKGKLGDEPSMRKVQETKSINIGTVEQLRLLNVGVNCTDQEVAELTQLFKEFEDVFAWTYDDLKEYDKSLFQHVIPLKEKTIPVRQKPRMKNPKLKLLIKI